MSESSGNRAFVGYKIIEDKIKKDFILQKYNGSQIGWTYIRSFPTLEEAEKWVLDGIKRV